MNSPIPLTEEIATYQQSLNELISSPTLVSLMAALRSALNCNVRLDQILNSALAVVQQPSSELTEQVKKSLPEQTSFLQKRRLDLLQELSPITALSEVFWTHLQGISIDELWTDGRRIFSVQQYVRHVKEKTDKSSEGLLSAEAAEAIRNVATASADHYSRISHKSKRLADAATERGYQYVPWGVFVNEYLTENTELYDGVRNLSQLISSYYAKSSEEQPSVLPECDRQVLCILFSAIARRIFDQIAGAPDEKIQDLYIYLKNSAMRGDSNAVLIDRDDAKELLFHYFSLAQNIALFCAALDIDPIEMGLLGRGEFARQYFDEYPVVELYDAIIVPSTNLEFLFLPPTAAKRVCTSLNKYESKSYDLIDILRFANYGIEDSERDFAKFRMFLKSELYYSNEDEEIFEVLTPLIDRITALIRTWMFSLEELELLNRHTDGELISDPYVQNNIKATFVMRNEVPVLEGRLPIEWLAEYPPAINVGKKSHPALCVIEFANADYCVDSRPNEWLTVATSLVNYGFTEAACTVLALMLLCDGKLVSAGEQSELEFRDLSRLLSKLRGVPSYSFVQFSLNCYRELTESKISATAYAFLADFFPRNNQSRLSTVKPIKSLQVPKEPLFAHPGFNSLSNLASIALSSVLNKLQSESYDDFFMAHSIVISTGTAIEYEFRSRFGNAFRDDKIFEELHSSHIRINRKDGPEGLKAFANIIRNFHGFSDSTRASLVSFSKIYALKDRELIIKAIDTLAELTNSRHGRVEDFEKPSDWIGRAEAVKKILLDSGLLRALCETA